MDILILLVAATGTAVATGLGALPVYLLGARTDALRPALSGATVGMMTVASIVGLIRPAFDEGSAVGVGLGIAVGVGFLVAARALLDRPRILGADARPGLRTSVLVFSVLLVHSLPEGFAIGSAYASDRAGLSLFIVLAIALHNVPEGSSIAVPMSAAGFGLSRQFWAAVATSLPQPPGALAAYLLVERIDGLLPASFGFAAGAMLALVAIELAPVAFVPGRRRAAAAGAALGGAVMLTLATVLNP